MGVKKCVGVLPTLGRESVSMGVSGSQQQRGQAVELC